MLLLTNPPSIRRLSQAALVVSGFLIGGSPAPARDVFVSPSGSDNGPGSRETPFASLAKATDILQPGDTCYLREGVYREVLRPARSGTESAEITFRAWSGEKVVISGADALTGWRDDGNGVWSAAMDWTLGDGDQLFDGDGMLSEARWPAAGDNFLFHPVRALIASGSANTLVCPEIPGTAADWTGAQLWCAGGAAWICWTTRITSYDPASHTLTFDRKFDKWYAPKNGNLFSLRGVRPALHAPGQWFHDTAAKRLLLIPPVGKTPSGMTVEAKRRKIAIDLTDRSHVRLTGITLHAGSLVTNSSSRHLTLEKLTGRHLAHSFTGSGSDDAGVLIDGTGHLVLNCDFGISSGSVLTTRGADHRIINNFLHQGSYAGMWNGAVALSGRRIIFSHNTVRHAGLGPGLHPRADGESRAIQPGIGCRLADQGPRHVLRP